MSSYISAMSTHRSIPCARRLCRQARPFFGIASFSTSQYCCGSRNGPSKYPSGKRKDAAATPSGPAVNSHTHTQSQRQPRRTTTTRKQNVKFTGTDEEVDAARRRIHILGTGSIGKLVAHSLRGIDPHPPITLLLHNKRLIEEWQTSSREISIITGDYQSSWSGFEVEPSFVPPFIDQAVGARRRERSHGGQEGQVEGEGEQRRTGTRGPESYVPPERQIHNLIVTVPANSTAVALSTISNRIAPDGTVMLLQNGMGTIDTLVRPQGVFEDPATRPNFVLGVTTHGVTAVNNWTALHKGLGSTLVGLPYLPDMNNTITTTTGTGTGTTDDPSSLALDALPASTRYLLETVVQAPTLAATMVSPSDLLMAQLEKVAINSVINPLTVLLDAPNGKLLGNYYLSRVMRLLIAEISTVIRALPELADFPDVHARFSAERLETAVLMVAKQTGSNLSSMLQAVRRGVPTEIEYINGYIVKRGEQMGFKCVMNYMIMQLIRGKGQMIEKEADAVIPFLRN